MRVCVPVWRLWGGVKVRLVGGGARVGTPREIPLHLVAAVGFNTCTNQFIKAHLDTHFPVYASGTYRRNLTSLPTAPTPMPAPAVAPTLTSSPTAPALMPAPAVAPTLTSSPTAPTPMPAPAVAPTSTSSPTPIYAPIGATTPSPTPFYAPTGVI